MFNISCLISSEEIETLKKVGKSNSANLYSVLKDGKTVVLKMTTDDTECFLTNTPVEQDDGDEYPVVSIVSKIDYSLDVSFKLENVKINSLSLIRDNLSWERDGKKWSVAIDVGVKVCTDKGEVLLLALDSVAGLILFEFSESLTFPCVEVELAEHWAFKTDSLLHSERKEIILELN